MNLPRHIAIIMDGNGRWAQARSLNRSFGHNAGAKAAEKIASACKDKGVEFLTLYIFSIENWDRPQDEVRTLMSLLTNYLRDEIEKLVTYGMRILFIGDRKRLSQEIIRLMEKVERASAHHSFCLVLAISYGGRDEIREAAFTMCKLAKKGLVEPSKEGFDRYISTNVANIPDPDLLIRTGGDRRVSNFLLWQMAYTELYFSDKYWPDFNEVDLHNAIAEFNDRERRYGK
jgi:undecaprenyl diphosphate synthase